LKWKIINSDRTLCLVEASRLEVEQLRISFTKTIPSARFDPRVKAGHWDGKISYFRSDRYLPSGLWGELIDVAEQYDFELEIEGIENLFDETVALEDFKSWVAEKWESASLKPRDYQVESAFKIIRNRNCLSELATSAGKSLIIFQVIAYLLEHSMAKRILMIVPNVDLVIQATEDFEQYNSESVAMDLRIQQIYSGTKIRESSNVVIGTYQSLIKKDPEYFDAFDTVVVDETHKAKGLSIRTILEKCRNSVRRFGLSGTIPKPGTLDRLTIMSYTGPVVSTVKADFLSKAGFIAPCEVIVIEMDYAGKQVKEAFKTIYDSGPDQRKQLFNLEKNYAIESKGRLAFITDFILQVRKNSLVLFHRIEYGQQLYNAIRAKTERPVFYIDGSTDKDFRESFKDDMEDGQEKILIASFGTFSTGINVKNIHAVFLTESFKSEVIIRQSIGRGLRLHKDKDRLLVVDFADNYSSDKDFINYLMKHSFERRAIYRQERFPYRVKKVRFEA